MEMINLDRAIEIKEQIEQIDIELDRLPITTHKRKLRFAEKIKKYVHCILRTGNGWAEGGLPVIETYYSDHGCIELSKVDIEALMNIRLSHRNELLEELKSL